MQTNFATRMADDSINPNTITYVGEADAGSLSSSAVWRIKKMDTTTGTIVLWADGNAQFDNIWDNREELNYA